MRIGYFCFFILLSFPIFSIAQSVKLNVQNMGGGSSIGLTYNADWSIGESTVIGSFSNSILQLNAGFLQPKTDIVTSVLELGSVVFGNQIQISPNPSFGKVKITFKMHKPGKGMMSIYNSASVLNQQIDFGEIAMLQTKSIELDNLPIGLYFLNVYYQPNSGLPESGIFKIIRL
jgi:hypothetical protein